MGAPMPHSTVLDLQLHVPCEPFARNLLPLYNSLLSLATTSNFGEQLIVKGK